MRSISSSTSSVFSILLILIVGLRRRLPFAFQEHFVLQVEQITAEYKALALKYHPDKNDGDKQAEQEFQKLKVSLRYLLFWQFWSKMFKWKVSADNLYGLI